MSIKKNPAASKIVIIKNDNNKKIIILCVYCSIDKNTYLMLQ